MAEAVYAEERWEPFQLPCETPTMDHDRAARVKLLAAVERLDPVALASVVGGLLLVPDNLHHAHRFEVLANLILAGHAVGKGDITRTKARSVVDRLLGAWTGENDDPWPNLATESFVYHGGNHLFVPGGTDRIYVLRSLAKTIQGSDALPRNFIERATSIIQFGCAISDDVCSHAGLVPDLVVPEPRGITMPPSPRFSRLRGAVQLGVGRLSELQAAACIRGGDADRFCLVAGVITEPHRMESSVYLQTTPIARFGDLAVVVAPHLIAAATIRQVLTLASEMHLGAELADEFSLISFITLDESLSRLGLKAISSPRASFGPTPGSHVAHILYQCDRDKVQHVMLVSDALEGTADWEMDVVEGELRTAHAEFANLMPRFQPPVRDWSSIVVCAPIARDCAFALHKGAVRVWLVSAGDCDAISGAELRDPLLLWKYQIAREGLGRSTTLVEFAPLDTYAAWRQWGRRFAENTSTPGLQISEPGLGESIRRAAVRRRGWRALPSWRDGTVTEVARAEGPEHPIYLSRGSGPHRIEMAVETEGPLVWLVYDGERAADPVAFDRMLDIARMASFWVAEFCDALRPQIAEAKTHALVVVHLVPVEGSALYAIETRERDIRVRVGILFTETYDDSNEAERRFALVLVEAVLHAAGLPNASVVVSAVADAVATPGVKRMLHSVNAGRNPAFRMAGKLPEARHVQEFDAHLAFSVAADSSTESPVLGGEDAQSWLKAAVGRLYDRLRSGLAQLDPSDALEDLLGRYEALVLEDDVRDLTFASVLACAERTPIVRRELDEQIVRHARAASATRFLIEHVVAEPPTGNVPMSTAVFDELLAIAAEIIWLGTVRDVARHGLANVRVRVGVHRYDLDLGGYEPAVRESRGQRHAERLDLEDHRKVVPGTGVGVADAFSRTAPPLPSILVGLSEGARAEFGRGIQDLAFLFGEALALAEDTPAPIVQVPLDEVIKRFSTRLGWSETAVRECLSHFILTPRVPFTTPPDGYRSADIWPWVFNRGLSYIRRPFVVAPTGILQFTAGHVATASHNLLMLLTTGRYRARTQELRAAMDTYVQTPSEQFAEEVGVVFRERGFIAKTHVKKIGALKIEQERGKDLGDVDVLVADIATRRVIAVECKDLQLDRMPHEMSTDLKALFLGSAAKASAQDKHLARVRWLEAHRSQVVRWLVGTEDDGWRIEAAMVLSRSLVTPYLGHARLPVWTIGQVRRCERP